MTMSIYLNREETLKLADYIGIGGSSIESAEITSMSIYGDLKEEKEKE